MFLIAERGAATAEMLCQGSIRAGNQPDCRPTCRTSTCQIYRASKAPCRAIPAAPARKQFKRESYGRWLAEPSTLTPSICPTGGPEIPLASRRLGYDLRQHPHHQQRDDRNQHTQSEPVETGTTLASGFLPGKDRSDYGQYGGCDELDHSCLPLNGPGKSISLFLVSASRRDHEHDRGSCWTSCRASRGDASSGCIRAAAALSNPHLWQESWRVLGRVRKIQECV